MAVSYTHLDVYKRQVQAYGLQMSVGARQALTLDHAGSEAEVVVHIFLSLIHI